MPESLRPRNPESRRSAHVDSLSFSKNPELERLLTRINAFLDLAEKARPEPPPMAYPLILLVGAPRSGTTLFMQWLQSTRAIAVPTNLISRFYVAPAFGVMVQRMLTDSRYYYRDEIDLQSDSDPSFSSDLGKTKGLLGHNTFSYFWRQFFPLAIASVLPQEALLRVDRVGIRRAIRRFIEECHEPLAMKGYLVQYHLGVLADVLDRVLFVHIVRDPLAVMGSLIEVRRRLYGDETKWWGCRPPGSEELDGLDPAIQVAGQVLLTDRSIRDQLGGMPAETHVEVRYEDLCSRPAEIWGQLRQAILALCDSRAPVSSLESPVYRGPSHFAKRAQSRTDRSRLTAAWECAQGLRIGEG